MRAARAYEGATASEEWRRVRPHDLERRVPPAPQRVPEGVEQPDQHHHDAGPDADLVGAAHPGGVTGRSQRAEGPVYDSGPRRVRIRAAKRAMSAARSGLGSVVLTAQTLRNHLEGDMMHDALRSDVLAALLAETPEDTRGAQADLREHAEHFREVLASNRQLATGDAAEALSGVGPALDS